MDSDEVREEILRGKILSIEMGTRLQIQVSGSGTQMKITCALIGMELDEFLIVTIPAIPGVLTKLSEGSTVTVRYMFGGGVYGFSARVLSCIRKPKIILFLSYPRTIEVLNLRKAPRLVSLMPAMVQIGENEFDGVIMDLSEGGCRFSVESEEEALPVIRMGEELDVTLQLTGIAGPQMIHGTVQNIRQDSKFAEIGVKFDQEDAEAITCISTYLKNILKLQEHNPAINRTIT